MISRDFLSAETLKEGVLMDFWEVPAGQGTQNAMGGMALGREVAEK